MNGSKYVVFIRPFYGVNILSDMGGDLGVVDYSNQVCCDSSILYAGSLAKKLGINTTVIDANATKEDTGKVLDKLSNLSYIDEIVVKVTAPSLKRDLEFCNVIKKNYPDVKITIVGHIVQILKQWIERNYFFIDNICESSIEDYVYKTFGDDKNKKISLPLELNDLPQVDCSLFPMQRYKTLGGKNFLYLWGSRGCKFHCDYCPYSAYFKKGIEFRKIDKVIMDIKAAIASGVEVIQFRDQFFTADRNRVVKLCDEIIKEGIKFEWYCETYISGLDEELLKKMYEAGNRLICIGIESASLNILRSHRRPIYSPDKLKKIVSIMNEIGIESVGFFMIGFENETVEQMYDTCKLAIDSGVTYAQFNIWTLYPDTDAFYNLVGKRIMNAEDFLPFENRVTYNPNKNLSREDIENLCKIFSFLFDMSRIGFEEAYKNFRYLDIQKKRFKHYLDLKDRKGL